MNTVTDEFVIRVTEEEDRILIEKINAIVKAEFYISKRLLVRAIDCFKEEHKEEFEMLTKADMTESEVQNG